MKNLSFILLSVLLFSCTNKAEHDLNGTTWETPDKFKGTIKYSYIEFQDSTATLYRSTFKGDRFTKYDIDYKCVNDTLFFDFKDENVEITAIPIIKGDVIVDGKTNEVIMSKRK